MKDDELIYRGRPSWLSVAHPASVDTGSTLRLRRRNGQYGYVDADDNWAIEPRFEYAKRFAEGMAPVRVDGKWGYISEDGRMVVPPEFVYAWGFAAGVAKVKSEGRTLYIDESGRPVRAPLKWAEHPSPARLVRKAAILRRRARRKAKRRREMPKGNKFARTEWNRLWHSHPVQGGRGG